MNLDGDWDLEKINRLSSYLLENYNHIDDVNLYIDYHSYTKLLGNIQEQVYHTEDHYGGSLSLCFFCTCGKIFIHSCDTGDKIHFSTKDMHYSLKITNKLKEYNKEFSDLINE